MYEFAHLVDGPDVSQHAPINTEVLKDAAAQVGADIVAVALPREAAGTVDHHVLASGDEFHKEIEAFQSDHQHLVDESVLPGGSLEMGKDADGNEMYVLRIHMTVAYL
eukprot:COSAG06_NODE_1806_length_8346_cov_5.200437_5_plen_108_part_00